MGDVKRYDAKRMMHGDTEYTEIAEDPSGRWVSILDYDSLRSLLVKACKEIAADRMAHSSPGTQWPIAGDIAEQYGVRLRWRKRRGWTEDTTK